MQTEHNNRKPILISASLAARGSSASKRLSLGETLIKVGFLHLPLTYFWTHCVPSSIFGICVSFLFGKPIIMRWMTSNDAPPNPAGQQVWPKPFGHGDQIDVEVANLHNRHETPSKAVPELPDYRKSWKGLGSIRELRNQQIDIVTWGL